VIDFRAVCFQASSCSLSGFWTYEVSCFWVLGGLLSGFQVVHFQLSGGLLSAFGRFAFWILDLRAGELWVSRFLAFGCFAFGLLGD
jgi:hypothetical protein